MGVGEVAEGPVGEGPVGKELVPCGSSYMNLLAFDTGKRTAMLQRKVQGDKLLGNFEHENGTQSENIPSYSYTVSAQVSIQQDSGVHWKDGGVALYLLFQSQYKTHRNVRLGYTENPI